MSEQRKNRKRGILLAGVLILAIAALAALYFWLKANGYLEIFTSVEALQAYVRGFGAWAPAIFILLQIAQVIFAPIPGNVTTLAGGALFGFWPSFFYSTVAICLGSLVAFGIGRYCGKPIVYKLASPAIVDKYLNVLAGKQRLTLALLFLFPFFPDDVLCLLAGLTGYSWSWFAVMVLLTRPWGTIVSALVGSGSLSIPLWGWAILVVAAVAAMVFSIWFMGRRASTITVAPASNPSTFWGTVMRPSALAKLEMTLAPLLRGVAMSRPLTLARLTRMNSSYLRGELTFRERVASTMILFFWGRWAMAERPGRTSSSMTMTPDTGYPGTPTTGAFPARPRMAGLPGRMAMPWSSTSPAA